MTLLTLPRELVEPILLWLATESVQCLQTCRLVNRELNKIIQSSTLLQYFLACNAAGVIDNSRSPLSYAERFEALKKREDAWRKIEPVFETTIQVKHQPSSVYDLTAGTYLLGDDNLKDLYYCHLPSSSQDNPRWTRIPGHGPVESWPGTLIDMGMAVYEHDLIVNVISSEVGNQADMQPYSLDLVLLKFSTGEYHPLARHPRIHVQKSPSSRPAISLEIVGDNLALVVNSRHGAFPDRLFVFDWKTGYKRLQHEATENAYSGLVFVSPELLLVPNLILSHFEVWHIPPSTPNSIPLVQILSLQIPGVSRGYFLLTLSCRGEPSPFLNSLPYFPQRPFFPCPEDSIIIANLRLASFPGLRGASYTLIIHRRALLDTIKKWTSDSTLEQQDDLPTWLTNEVTVQIIADLDNGSVRLDTLSKLVSTMPHPRSSSQTRASPVFATTPTSPTFPTHRNSLSSSTESLISFHSDTSSISSGSSASSTTSRYNFLQVQWPDWGPPISRWFRANETQTRWITTSTGQRCAFLFPSLDDRGMSTVSIADFNPHNLRRNAEKIARGGQDNVDSEQWKDREEEEEEELDHDGVFSEQVRMGLKCVVYPALGEYDFDGLLMDEERLLGLKINQEGRIESIQVLYFG